MLNLFVASGPLPYAHPGTWWAATKPGHDSACRRILTRLELVLLLEWILLFAFFARFFILLQIFHFRCVKHHGPRQHETSSHSMKPMIIMKVESQTKLKCRKKKHSFTSVHVTVSVLSLLPWRHCSCSLPQPCRRCVTDSFEVISTHLRHVIRSFKSPKT